VQLVDEFGNEERDNEKPHRKEYLERNQLRPITGGPDFL
jgi:hypothetical protein